MIPNLPLVDELAELLEASCLGELTPAQERRLHELVCSDSDCRIHYVLFMNMHAMIERREGQAGRHASEMLESRDDRLTEAVAPPSAPLPSFLGNAIHGATGYFSSGWPVAYLVATVILGIGLLIGGLTHVSRPVQLAKQLPSAAKVKQGPEPETAFVGRITGMVDCRWDDLHAATIHGAHVPLGRRYALASGLLEISYDTGAKIIVQGPATYEVESKDGGYLSVGKLTAKVEKKGNDECRMMNDKLRTVRNGIQHSSLSTQHLFAVRTPTAVVTDLGTEFGVEVSETGVTTSHVFRGSVRLQVATADGNTEGVARVLHEQESARVEKVGDDRVTVVGLSAQRVDFVRELPRQTVKTIDLVDVVAGGDGFSGRRNAGIDASNGRTIDTVPQGIGDYIVGDGEYHRKESPSFVDGVFIPDGRRGPVQIDSAGHTFEFPATSNETVHAVWAGGAIPVLVPTYPVPRSELDGVDYASAGHGLLFMHANKGITFDLEAIRRANPECKLVRFRAMAGNTEMSTDENKPGGADVWVLIDGQSRFHRREINRYTGAFSVAIPIADNDRFLTLAATDGGNGISWDWILFGDPRLELAPTKASVSSVAKSGQAE
jgi:hypothetical protein